MKKLTPLQRRSVYFYIAENYPTCQSRYLCNQLKIELTDKFGFEYGEGYEYTFESFPEFELFRQNEDDSTYSDGWFSNSGERIICMLLCAEMCNP